jgi:histidinol-phosphate aminotransferase
VLVEALALALDLFSHQILNPSSHFRPHEGGIYLNDEGRAYLEKSFGEMGLEHVPSHANFVLVKVGDGDAVFHAMLKRGVIIRAMRGYKLPEWVRISVGTMPQNERCIATLKEVLAAS